MDGVTTPIPVSLMTAMIVATMMVTMMLARIMRIIALIMTMTHVTVIAISTATVETTLMKKITFLLTFLMVCVASFAQDEPNDTINKPSKFASWTISSAFQAEAGFVGSYWKPTFNIALDKEGYYCVVNLYNQSGYYSIENETLPHLYLKTDKGEVVDLEMDGDEPVHKFYLKGYYSMNVWMPGRYVTRLIYYIPDIDKFLANYYVKYRVWLGEGFKDVELSKSYAKKYNNRLKNAANEVTNKYETKKQSLNNPLEGF